ncbi:MAG TPA: protein kinase [Polyangiaceae bacterium]|jgi:tRNA A-37 threonylcarbamoyl transferase component Bud32|nr:protein kinase [Polyangiaceae bacterium]
MGGMLQPGDVVDGKYAIERIVGRGGAGYVAVARHLVLDRRVALKFLRPELQLEPDLCKRFVREARAAAQMKGPHVARVLDADASRTAGPYLVMEFLEGEDMAVRLRRGGPLRVAEAADCVLQACEAVHEAHALRIVHRDIKPANLFLTATAEGTPFVKVLDFGLSKEIGRAYGAENLTDSNHVVGSPHFMAPEQIRTPKDVDERTDIWALGATLFDLLTGHVPFGGGSMMEVCAALFYGPPPTITRYRSDVPPALEAIVLRCLRVEPCERPQSIAELAELLAPFASASARQCVARIEATGTFGATAVARRTHATQRLAVAIGLAAALALAAMVLRARSAPLPPAASPAPPTLALARGVTGPPPGAPVPHEPPQGGSTLSNARGAELGDSDEPRGLIAVSLPPRDSAPARKPVRLRAAEVRIPAPTEAESRPQAAEPRAQACAQPFYIDRQGLKAVRPECL